MLVQWCCHADVDTSATATEAVVVKAAPHAAAVK